MATFTSFLKLYKPVTNEVGWDDNMNTNLDTIDGFTKQFMNIPGFVGTWVNSTLYTVGQIALDIGNAQFYRCAVQNTSAATGTFAQDRTARPTLWTLTTSPAADSASAAAASASAAANSANVAAGQFNSFRGIYYGPFASAPLNDPLGNAKTTGDLYFDTTTQAMNVWSGTVWIPITAAFNDAPTTPAGAVFVRTAAHTWAVGVGQAGGLFIGDVSFGSRVFIGGGAAPSANMPAGFTYGDRISVLGEFGQNMYLSITPPFTPTNPGYRYIHSTSTGVGAFIIQSSTIQAAPNAGVRITQFFSTPTGEASSNDSGATPKLVAQMDSNGNFLCTGGGFQPGGGLWNNSASDVRVKNVVGPYPRGLAELLEMLPKLYTFKGNDNYVAPDGGIGQPIHTDTTKQYIGLIAQDCEPYMPELVTTTSAYIDGVLQTDVRQLNATGVIYALVNAVAELDARLKALEGP